MEKLGASAEFQELSEVEALTMLRELGLTETQMSDFDSALDALISPRQNVVCGIFPAEEPGKEQPDDDSEEDDSETKSRLVVNF